MASRIDAKKQARERIAQERAAAEAQARRKRITTIVIAAVVVLAVVAGGIWWQSNRTKVQVADEGPQIASTKTDEGIVLGTAGPDVDIYLDFLCPHCAEMEDNVGATIDDMVTSGEMKLTLHPVTLIDPTQSARAAAAFACAADTGTMSILGYERALFANQAGGFTADRLIQIAKGVGITGDTFESCVKNDDMLDWAASIDKNARTRIAQITPNSFGTPTILVNGEMLSLARTLNGDDFRAGIQSIADSTS